MKNLQNVWSVLCTGVSIDQESNNLSLFNIIDQVHISKEQLIKMPTKDGEEKPAAPISFNLVSLWKKIKNGTSLKAEVEVDLLDPDGVVRQKANYSIDLSEKIERLRSRIQWNGIRITSSGTYTFRISAKENGQKKFEIMGEVYLNIEILETLKEKDDKKIKR